MISFYFIAKPTWGDEGLARSRRSHPSWWVRPNLTISLDKKGRIMTPSPAMKPPKSPNHVSTNRHSRHSVHSPHDSLDCLLSPLSSSEYSPLVPRGGGDAAAAAAAASGGGGRWWEKKSLSLPIPNGKTSGSLLALPSPDDADATADGVAAAATNETKKGDGECDDVAFTLRSLTSALIFYTMLSLALPISERRNIAPSPHHRAGNRLGLLRDIRVREFHYVRAVPVRLHRRDLRARRLPAAHQRAQQASHTVERRASGVLHRVLHPAVRDWAGSGRR